MIVHHIKTYKTIFLLALGLGVSQVNAQEKEEKKDKQDLGTEVVNVVKPYTPTISDAFKVKATPKLNDSVNTTKKKVTYSIFSAPVASTFTPAKGKAAAVKKAPKLKLYDNYATIGFGSFTSVLAEFYSNFQISRTEDFGVFLNHNSSQGGIDNVRVDDFFYDTRLNLNYGARERDFSWRTDLDVQHQVFNWYGISPTITDMGGVAGPILTDDFDVTHSYLTGAINGSVAFKDAIFKEGKATVRYLTDSESSNELRAIIKPTIELPIAGENITTGFIVDYVNGSFANDFSPNIEETKHSILNVGVNPSLVILRDDLTVNLGVAGFVSMDSENSNTDFFVYPRITASYRVVSDYFIAYAGLEGNLQQNSYYDFVQENPFVAPSLAITPTDQQYDGYLGMKGKLSNSISYNLRANYVAESNKALFIFNPAQVASSVAFLNGNSFSIVYDDVETLGVFGELNFDVNSNFKMKINGQFNSYTTDNQEEAWNLPELRASVFADYQITQQWFAGINLFFVGERQDLLFANDPTDILAQPQVVTLDSYLDANAHVGYRFNDRLSAFGRVNNILNSDYQKWVNYEVQGLQGMIGATYRFDF
ncbi:TonB-dependent receptor [uncultured Dokdonia sp.]|uniref:TonB-dependent receptor n=1 Tax=uncultured Dokdonia sp. TaxID=575653 RepID=UPI002616B495|nr:TonB-dependent receptor [uncultured Dokdonia sp.]